MPVPVEILATVLFGFAILHTFSVKRFEHLAHKYPEGSVGENTFHLLGEVEVVFGLWASFLIIGMAFMKGGHAATEYLEGLEFKEPFFVIVIMAISATRPVLQFTAMIIEGVSRFIPLPKGLRFYIAALIVGPLLGSFIDRKSVV